MITKRHALIGSLAALPGLAALPAFARSNTGTADAALDTIFESVAPPALAAGIVTREGLTWSGVRGVRRQGGTEPATLDDRWHLGSNTKAMTAALYARLVEAGLSHWDRPVTDIFPDLTADPAWAGVTLETVMAHRAGLRDDTLLPRHLRIAARDDPRPVADQRLDRVRAALAVPPGGPTGAWVYANINYVLVGAAIERLTGTPWETALVEHLFRPAGITGFGFGAPTGNQPWGHQTLDGVTIPLDPELKPDNPPLMGPAGTVHMTLPDYARFIGLFLDQGGDVLSPASIARLTTPLPGSGRAYALGWLVQPRPPWAAGPVITHEGSNTLWHAIVVADPAGGRAVIALSNDEARGGPACQQLVPHLIAAG